MWGDSNLNMINIEFYNTESGECPVAEFILSLDSKMKAKVLRTIDLLENNGTLLREPYSKSLGDGIFELRIKQGNDITSVLYFFFIDNKAILTDGFIKKTQKTPKNVIETAKKYREDYQRRNQND